MECLLCQKAIDESNPETTGHIRYLLETLYGKDYLKEDDHVCQKCGREYLLERYAEKYVKLLEPLYRELNNMAGNHDNINAEAFADAICAEHRQLQAYMIEFLLEVFRVLGKRAEDDRWVDARNSWAFKYLKKLSAVEVY